MGDEKPVIRISVRNVVEMTLYDPDLQTMASTMERMREGTKAHLARQTSGRQTEEEYRSEVPLSCDYETDDLILHVTGRADALFQDDDGQVVEELKLGTAESVLNSAHMAQAEMYGHMLLTEDGGNRVRILVRYVDVSGQVQREYGSVQCAEVLRARFEELCAPAARRVWRDLQRARRRNASIKDLPFPFPAYRTGQRMFSAAVYRAIRDRIRLFAQAPTGIGKTMAAIYPAVHALRLEKCQRVLFLTARTTGRQAAIEAARRLHGAGAWLETVEIMAKGKACPYNVQECRPESCPRARGFYDRLIPAMDQMEAQCIWDTGAIRALADEWTLCPFELSLEMANRADLVICDYNYAYDPAVAIDRLTGGGVAILVDEAHRLAERVRDDYSIFLRLREVRELRRMVGKSLGRKSAVYRALSGVLEEMQHLASIGTTAANPPWGEMGTKMETLLATAGEMVAGSAEGIAEALSLAMDWLSVSKRWSERYTFLTEGTGDQFEMGIYLMDAAPEILEVSRHARGVAYFSATLAPLPAAMRILGHMPEDLTLMLPSPFRPEALRVRALPIDVRYRARQVNASRVAKAVETFLQENPGNTMVFFPSYAYLEIVADCFEGREMPGGRLCLREQRGMTDEDRAEMLSCFGGDEEKVLLCVLGGSFAEGIDLPGDRLKNVAVISTGMPTMDARIRAMQQYYQARGEDGFFYTMTLPGMIRVIQAAGRLIRTETDTGSLLLIDLRYGQRQTRSLLDGTLIGAALAQGENGNA
ncbi:MAG: hypothetical protein IJ088_06815 [Clostridia bacterium]|nr:hypothetical protein [Clostridia bacterium]